MDDDRLAGGHRVAAGNDRGVVVDEGAGRPQSLGDPGDARGLGRRLELAVPRDVTTTLAHGDGRQCSDISGVHHLEGCIVTGVAEYVEEGRHDIGVGGLVDAEDRAARLVVGEPGADHLGDHLVREQRRAVRRRAEQLLQFGVE